MAANWDANLALRREKMLVVWWVAMLVAKSELMLVDRTGEWKVDEKE
jgi:hypothetical protein